MAEYNKGKFFWIKLTDKFLNSDTVDFLMSQKDGANYVVLYQMLCLKTVNNDGILGRQLGEIIVAYDAEKICRDCKYFSIDTVRVALELYKSLGLVYEYENGLLRITNFENLVGSKSIGAERKQQQRENRKKVLELGENVGGGQKVDICPPEIDIDIDIEIEKDKEIYKDKKKKNNIIKSNSIDENFESLWKMLKSTPYDRKSKVTKKRKKELFDMGFDRTSTAIELYLQVQDPKYYHKRDNFLNEIIDNYLDKDISDFPKIKTAADKNNNFYFNRDEDSLDDIF